IPTRGIPKGPFENSLFGGKANELGPVPSSPPPAITPRVAIVELRDHPWFVAFQWHPQFKSKPTQAHPLACAFAQASLNEREREERKLNCLPFACSGAPVFERLNHVKEDWGQEDTEPGHAQHACKDRRSQ